MQGHRRDHGRMRVGCLDRPPRARQVAPDLHHPIDPDGTRGIERVVDRQPGVAVTDVEVAVAVGHRDRERFGPRRVRRVAATSVALGATFTHRLERLRVGHDDESVASTGSSSRGKSESPLVRMLPAGSCPTSRHPAPAGRPAPRARPRAPSICQSDSDAFGITGLSSTARIRSPSAAEYKRAWPRARGRPDPRRTPSPPSTAAAR